MTLETLHGPLRLPAYLPDATRGVVRCVDADDLRGVGIEALMVNAFHLMLRPGASRVKRLGGVHRFTGWTGPVVTDSGGFQALSLIRENEKNGTIRPDGLLFRTPEGKKVHLTPERCIRTQLALGSDVVVALDDCAPADADEAECRASVERTVRWTAACKEELDRAGRKGPKPLLVGVVQGGRDLDLRRRCAADIAEIGVDAFGFGGWPVDDDGTLRLGALEAVAQTVGDAPIFALGIGKPEHLVAACEAGLQPVFDCSLPTRDARRGRLFVQTGATSWRSVYLRDDKHANRPGPLSEYCDAPCCRLYGAAYLHHLFKVKDSLAERLATLHNLRFYARLIERLREGV